MMQDCLFNRVVFRVIARDAADPADPQGDEEPDDPNRRDGRREPVHGAHAQPVDDAAAEQVKESVENHTGIAIRRVSVNPKDLHMGD